MLGSLRWEAWIRGRNPGQWLGIIGKLHFTGIVFPGVSCVAIGGFILAAIANDLAADKNWYSVIAVIAVLGVEVALTVLITLTLWRLRHFAGVGPKGTSDPI